MLELTGMALLGAGLLAGTWTLQRFKSGASAYWLAAWVAAAGGVLLLVEGSLPHLALLAYPFGTMFPWLLLSGALALGGRRPSSWLFAVALATGTGRAVLAALGNPGAAWLAALLVEPGIILTAAWIAHRSGRPRVYWAQRALAPSLVALAAAGAWHSFTLMRTDATPPGLIVFWMVAGPLFLGVQLLASSERDRQLLRSARDELGRRVAARTVELERANASLRRSVGELRETEHRLRESEDRYRVVSELSSDFSFSLLLDPERGVQAEWVTEAFERITGYGPEVLEGWGSLALLSGEQAEGTREQMRHARGSGVIRNFEREILTSGGEPRTLLVTGLTADDAEGGGLRVLGAARDVTDARRAERERQSLERRMHDAQRIESLGILTGGIAHDFNNLLAVILGNARLLLDDAAEASPATARLGRIRVAGEHAARLTEQMLSYAGKASVSLASCDLSALVRGMGDLLAASVGDSCELETDLEPDAVVEGDATRLSQVVLNLVTNASEAAAAERSRGHVWIRTRRVHVDESELAPMATAPGAGPGDYVALEVADAGPGMDDEVRKRAFEPFFSTRFSGRGLGLASVLGIVRAHRGAVRIESEPGQGTRVYVLLPAGTGPVASEKARAETATGSGTVLVVDDDPDVLELAREFLTRAGHEVVTARGGSAALEVFLERRDEIDAVVLDLSMPDMSGEEVFLQLRESGSEVPVVLATGYSEEIAADRFRAQGVSVLLRKPYEPAELVEAVRAAREDD